jgi:hypothetical protein
MPSKVADLIIRFLSLNGPSPACVKIFTVSPCFLWRVEETAYFASTRKICERANWWSTGGRGALGGMGCRLQASGKEREGEERRKAEEERSRGRGWR